MDNDRWGLDADLDCKVTQDDAAVGRLFQSIIKIIKDAERDPEDRFFGFCLVKHCDKDGIPLRLTLTLRGKYENITTSTQCE